MSTKKIKTLREIPIFPLPNLVFFPKTFLPLHIFESRYLKMIEDARSADNLLGMVLLKKGWESNYFGNPDVYEIACVGKIEQIEKLQDGKYNILLYGLSRIKIMDFVQEEPYRTAQVKYLTDRKFDHKEFREEHETHLFVDLMKQYLQEIGIERSNDLVKMDSESLEAIMNQVASILDFTITEKQALLELESLENRYQKTKELLKQKVTALRIARRVKFVPEDPSLN